MTSRSGPHDALQVLSAVAVAAIAVGVIGLGVAVFSLVAPSDVVIDGRSTAAHCMTAPVELTDEKGDRAFEPVPGREGSVSAVDRTTFCRAVADAPRRLVVGMVLTTVPFAVVLIGSGWWLRRLVRTDQDATPGTARSLERFGIVAGLATTASFALRGLGHELALRAIAPGSSPALDHELSIWPGVLVAITFGSIADVVRRTSRAVPPSTPTTTHDDPADTL